MNGRKFLGLLLVGSSLVACGGDNTTPTPDSGTPQDVQTSMDGDNTTDVVTPPPDTQSPPDVPRDVRGDTGPSTMCGSLPFTVIPRTGEMNRVMGDTSAAWMQQTMGRPTATSPIRRPSATICTAMSGQLVYRYTSGAQAAFLRISTTNMGTPRAFDTVLWVTQACPRTATAQITPIGCNDDDPEFAASADRRVSSLVTTPVLPANTTIYIVIGGFYPPASGGATTDRGPFELTIQEIVPVAAGGRCRVDGLMNRCGDGLDCVGDDPGADMGTCRTVGSVAGSECRTSAPECDVGLTCNMTSRVCQRVVGDGMPCNAFQACEEGFFCANTTIGAIQGVCRRVGTVLRAPCRPVGAMGGRCEMPFVCSSDIDSADMTPTCVRQAMLNGPCDLFDSVCPMGSSCVTDSNIAVIGTCRAHGTGPRTRCRTSGTACDMGLMCLQVGEGAGAESLCLRASSAGMACAPDLQCPDGTTCYLTDVSDRIHGRCGPTGGLGGACNATDPRCTGMLSCSVMGEGGLCQNVAMAGQPCDGLTIRCADGLTCVRALGSTAMGACRAEGSVAGAECRSGDMPCMSPLVCSGSALSGGFCQTPTTMAGAMCDPINGTTRCPMGSFCRATAFNRGTCEGGAMMEMDANNNTPAQAAMRPVTAPTLFTGSLPFGDVDCYTATVPANGAIVALVSDGNGRCPAPFQGAISMDLYSPDGTTVRGISTRSGPGACSHIDGARATVFPWARGLAAGNYTVCVRGLRDAATNTGRVESYVLSLAPTTGM